VIVAVAAAVVRTAGGRRMPFTRSTPTVINRDADALSPAELGLPAKYSSWRVNQYEAVERILGSSKRFIAICAPVGFGKSLAIAGAAVISGQRTVTLTMTRGLQDQYSELFSEVFADVRGLANYICPIAGELGVAPTTTAADAPCQCGYSCKFRRGLRGCGYYDAYRAAQHADAVCTNYACWLHDGRKESEQSGNLQFGVDPEMTGDRPVGILFCDEAHTLIDALGMFIGEDISRRECLQLHLPWPDSGGTIDDWQCWAIEQCDGVSERLKDLEVQVRNGSNGSGRGWTRELKHLRDIKRKLERLSTMQSADEWIISESDTNESAGTMSGVRFDPLSPARYAESALFRGIEKVVLVSATVRPKTAQMLGIASGDLEFVEYPSTFPVERRPIIHTPSHRMTYHTEQNDELMREWLAIFDGIVEPRLALGWKGIAHCVSYRRAKFIMDNSRHSQYMMIHSSFNRAQVIEEFKQSAGPRWLLSPSVDTGYDFPGDLCRVQIIVKLPFSSVTDPVVKARKQRDPDYDLYQTAQTLIQMSGRAVRSESDFAETWLLDDSLSWALPRMFAKGYIPRWWRAAFRSVDVAPSPVEFAESE
jgi:ATP-dependent DNA helicase DinG